MTIMDWLDCANYEGAISCSMEGEPVFRIRRLCCTNGKDSPSQPILVMDGHEQTTSHSIPDDELAFV